MKSPSDATLREALRALGDDPETLTGVVDGRTFVGRTLIIASHTTVQHCHFTDCVLVLAPGAHDSTIRACIMRRTTP